MTQKDVFAEVLDANPLERGTGNINMKPGVAWKGA
jgi:hypothetical protein